MASARSPSPAGDASRPGSPELSPRSKIKAMLAGVDNDDSDSDHDPTGPIDVKALFRTAPKPADPSEKAPLAPGSQLSGDDNPEQDDDNDNADDVVLPRGRMARRMQGRPKTPEPQANDDATPSSPGLFVTPSPNQSLTSPRRAAPSDDEEDDVPQDLSKNERFKALVARKREERLAKEAEEQRKQQERAERMAQQAQIAADTDDDVSDISDDAGGRKLTQDVSRPSRKAGKKAIEEMNRETQRLSRSLQLAHEAKTKKKITKASLFERFNFRTANAQPNVAAAAVPAAPSSSRPSSPITANHTDAEAGDAATPPSSPPVSKDIADPPAAIPAPNEPSAKGANEDEEIPDIAAVFDQAKIKSQEKAKATTTDDAVATKPKRQFRVKLPLTEVNMVQLGADDELEVIHPHKSKLDAIFDRVPEKKEQASTSMNAWRHLANVSSPPKEAAAKGKKAQLSMTVGELHMSLQQRARAQAKLERERRVEFLRSKGHDVQTDEERLRRDQEMIEDRLEQRLREAEEIMNKELEAAKEERKERRKTGDVDVLDWDDSDDESFHGSQGEEESPEIELSGSEEEEEEEEEEDNEEAEEDAEQPKNPLVVEEAADSESDAESAITSQTRAIPGPRSRRDRRQALLDSDDEEEVVATPRAKKDAVDATAQPVSASSTRSPQPPTSVLRSATKKFIPGLPVAVAGPAGLGLTQMFAGTMDDSQPAPSLSGEPQEFMPSFDDFPDSQFSATANQSQRNDDMVLNSQPTEKETQPQESETQGVQLHYSQSQAHGFDTLMRMDSTQTSEMIEPTQDGGFQDFTPLKQRFVDAPQSTVDTVMAGTAADEEVQNSPLLKKRGKLMRRNQGGQSPPAAPSTAIIPRSPSPISGRSAATEVERSAKGDEAADEAQANAFRLMEKGIRRQERRKKKFDKKKSKATEMVEEQAEESEDEYAGLGGADGEDSSDEDEELAKEMIDDAAGNKADESKLAELHGRYELERNAEEIKQLQDEILGGKRSKRRRGGHDLDLSDDEDGDAIRRKKRRDHERVLKALRADERIEKIAENPRVSAFLRTIGNQDSDDDMDFDDHFAANTEHSQSQTEESIPDSQPSNDQSVSTNVGRKRSRMEPHEAARVAPNLRGKNDHLGVRPASLQDVQKTLSSLLDDPDAMSASIIPATDADSDEEPDAMEADKENRRQPAVVNRLKRDSSASASADSGSNGTSARPAFELGTSGSIGSGFKVPALLRRATTNNSLISASSAGNGNGATSTWNASGSRTGSAGGQKAKAGGSLLGDEVKIKKSAGKGSGVNYFARETERRAAVAEADKRREKRKWKGVEGREKAFGGLFGQGGFE